MAIPSKIMIGTLEELEVSNCGEIVILRVPSAQSIELVV